MTRTKSSSTTTSNSSTKPAARFSKAELSAMRERSQELQGKKASGEDQIREKLSELPMPDRRIGEEIHRIIGQIAPQLKPRTWYGMPAYADDKGKVVCFFQAAAKFDTRYATLGFNDNAHLDDGAIWPTAFAITKITPAVKQEIAHLLKRAAGNI